MAGRESCSNDTGCRCDYADPRVVRRITRAESGTGSVIPKSERQPGESKVPGPWLDTAEKRLVPLTEYVTISTAHRTTPEERERIKDLISDLFELFDVWIFTDKKQGVIHVKVGPKYGEYELERLIEEFQAVGCSVWGADGKKRS